MAEKNTRLITVTHGQVHGTKNPNVSVISVSDEKSVNNFSSFPVFANEVSEAGDGKRSNVKIDLDRDYDISRPAMKDGKRVYEHETVKGSDIVAMFEESKLAAIESKNSEAIKAAAKEPENEPAEKNAFMNRVSEKLIHATKKAGLMRVSLPDAESSTGMANILVPQSNIFQSTRRGKEPIPGMKNINLGLESDTIKYSIAGTDGKFIQSEKTAKEVAEYWAKTQSDFLLKNDMPKEAPETSVQAGNEKGFSDFGFNDEESFG